MPKNKGSIGINIIPFNDTNLNLELLYIGKRRRESLDTRGALDSYITADLAISKRKIFDHISVKGSIKNLFDKDYKDPTPLVNGLAGDDIRRPGITYMLEIEYVF